VGDHPETERMMEDIRSGAIKTLIFSKLARLARNTKQLLEFADFFRDYDSDLVSLQESIDTSTPAGRLFYTVIAAMAQWEREEIADRVAASVPVRAKMGKPLGGVAAFGYKWNEGTLEPDEDEAPVRRLIYEIFSKNPNKKATAKELNDRGYRTRKGARFSDTTIDRLIRDTTAKGIRTANHTKSRGDGKAWDEKPESDWVLIPVEPIVSEELWNECNTILDQNRQKNRSRRKGRPANKLFTGIVRCGCGGKMSVPSSSKKYVCTTKGCKNRIPMDDLEEIFKDQLVNFLISPTEIEKYLKDADDELNRLSTLVSTTVKEETTLEAKMDSLLELYENGAIAQTTFQDRFRPLEERKQELVKETAQIQAQIDLLSIGKLESSYFQNEGKDLASKWPNLEFSEKRQIVEHLVDCLSVGENTINLRFTYFPHSKDLTKRQHNLRDSSPQRD